MALATNRAIREQHEPTVHRCSGLRPPPVVGEARYSPHLILLDGRVQDSVLVARALAGGPRSKTASEELYRRYRAAVSRLAASFPDLDPPAPADVPPEPSLPPFPPPA